METNIKLLAACMMFNSFLVIPYFAHIAIAFTYVFAYLYIFIHFLSFV